MALFTRTNNKDSRGAVSTVEQGAPPAPPAPRGKIADTEQTLTDLRREQGELEAQAERLRNSIVDYDAEFSRLANSLGDIEEMAPQRHLLDAAVAQINVAITRVESMRGQIESYEAALHGLRQQVEDVRASIRQRRAQNAEAQRRIDEVTHVATSGIAANNAHIAADTELIEALTGVRE